MSKNYVSNVFTITDEYIGKFKRIHNTPEGISENNLREGIEGDFLNTWYPIRDEMMKGSTYTRELLEKKLNIKIKPTHSILEAYEEQHILPLIFNLYEAFLKHKINETTIAEYQDEIKNSIHALAINIHSKNIPFNAKIVRSTNETEDLRIKFNDDRYEIKTNYDLLDKIDGGKNNNYIEFLSDSIEYLQAKKPNKQTNVSGLTYREQLIIMKYKHEGRYIPYPIPAELKKESTGLYKAYYTVLSTGKSFKNATSNELKKIIPHLIAFPNAKKIAENDLDSLS